MKRFLGPNFLIANLILMLFIFNFMALNFSFFMLNSASVYAESTEISPEEDPGAKNPDPDTPETPSPDNPDPDSPDPETPAEPESGNEWSGDIPLPAGDYTLEPAIKDEKETKIVTELKVASLKTSTSAPVFTESSVKTGAYVSSGNYDVFSAISSENPTKNSSENSKNSKDQESPDSASKNPDPSAGSKPPSRYTKNDEDILSVPITLEPGKDISHKIRLLALLGTSIVVFAAVSLFSGLLAARKS